MAHANANTHRSIFTSVIFLPAHPASYTHNLVSKMQSFNFGGSQDAMILHDFSMKINSVQDP